MAKLDGTCEVRTVGPTDTNFPHPIASTCDRPAEFELDLTLPACTQQNNPPLVFRVRLCRSHISAYTGWH